MIQLPEQTLRVARLVHIVLVATDKQKRLVALKQPPPQENRTQHPARAHVATLWHCNVPLSNAPVQLIQRSSLERIRHERDHTHLATRVKCPTKRIHPEHQIVSAHSPQRILTILIVTNPTHHPLAPSKIHQRVSRNQFRVITHPSPPRRTSLLPQQSLPQCAKHLHGSAAYLQCPSASATQSI